VETPKIFIQSAFFHKKTLAIKFYLVTIGLRWLVEEGSASFSKGEKNE
jgi:hypothetical protein